MSLELFVNHKVFSYQTISPALIRYLYKPYGELTDQNIEKQLEDAVRAKEKVILRSWRGWGKSCVINYVISMLDESFFPIPIMIRPASTDDKLCSNASMFARFILSRILKAVNEAGKIKKGQCEQYRKYLSGSIDYKNAKTDKIAGRLLSKLSWLPGFASTSAEVAGETGEYIEYAMNHEVYAEDQVGCINEIVNIHKNKEISMVIVLDDTDKFLQIGSIDKTKLIEEFFSFIMPFVSDLDCAVIIPVHETYTSYENYKYAEKAYIDRNVRIPELDYQSFIDMMNHKVNSVLNDNVITDFIDSKALKLVYEHKYTLRNEERMRDTLYIIDSAVKEAEGRNEEVVDYDTMITTLLN